MLTMLRALLVSVLSLTASSAWAQNAAAGKLFYDTPILGLSCGDAGSCHGPNPNANVRNIKLGTSAAVILAAPDKVPQMAFLKTRISAQNAADLAAYITNPAAAVSTSVALSDTTLMFGQTQVGMTNSTATPATITVTNSGGSALTITGVAKAGANAADFTPTGTCAGASVTVAAGASCTLSATFTPTAAGMRAATFTLQSNAASNPTITLSGTAGMAGMAGLAVSQTAITFNAQTVGTTSMARLVGVTNNSTMPVSITQTSTTPNNEFMVSGGCVATLGPGSSCSMEVTFSPAAAGARSGTLTITSNAAGSPHTVTLAGPAVTVPTGIATLAVSALSFPMTPIAASAPPQAAVLINTGNAMLSIASVAIDGPNAADFKLGTGTTCAAGNLDVDASCRVEAEFKPMSAGTKSANVVVTHVGGATTLSLSGTTPQTSGAAPGSPRTSMSLLRPSNAGAGAVDPWTGLLVLLAALGARRWSGQRSRPA